MTEGGVFRSVLTLGFDPKTGHYIGTFIALMMSHLWVYNGAMDSSGKAITLDTQGPSFSGEGLANYQDIIEFLDDDHRVLKSQVPGEDGQWNVFMTASNRRKR